MHSFAKIHDSMDLPEGRRVIVLDWSGKSDSDAARNLFLVGREGDIIWRVSSKFDADSGPFTKIISFQDGKLKAHRWDGGAYEIEMKTGFATPREFLK